MTDRSKKVSVVASFIFILIVFVIFALLVIVRDTKKSKEIVPEVTTEAFTESEEIAEPAECEGVEVIYYEIPAEY